MFSTYVRLQYRSKFCGFFYFKISILSTYVFEFNLKTSFPFISINISFTNSQTHNWTDCRLVHSSVSLTLPVWSTVALWLDSDRVFRFLTVFSVLSHSERGRLISHLTHAVTIVDAGPTCFWEFEKNYKAISKNICCCELIGIVYCILLIFFFYKIIYCKRMYFSWISRLFSKTRKIDART